MNKVLKPPERTHICKAKPINNAKKATYVKANDREVDCVGVPSVVSTMAKFAPEPVHGK